MSAVLTPDSPDAATSGVVRFTPRGNAALDLLATVLTAHCSGTPEGIAMVLDQVMHADLADLAEALSAIVDATEQRTHLGPGPDTAQAEAPGCASQARGGRPDLAPSGRADPARAVTR